MRTENINLNSIFWKAKQMEGELLDKYLEFNINKIYYLCERDDWEWDTEYEYIRIELSNEENISIGDTKFESIDLQKISWSYNLKSNEDKEKLIKLEKQVKNWERIIILWDWNSFYLVNKNKFINKISDNYINNISWNIDVKKNKQIKKEIKEEIKEWVERYISENNLINWNTYLLNLYNSYKEDIKFILNNNEEDKEDIKLKLDNLEEQVDTLKQQIKEIKNKLN